VVETSRSFTGTDRLQPATTTEQVVFQQTAARTHAVTYTAGSGGTPTRVLSRSAEGRAVRSDLGLHGRVERIEVGTWSGSAFVPSSFAAVVLGYDARGRIETVTHGSGGSARVTTFSYDSDGFVGEVLDAAVQEFDFGYDDVGRPTSLTLPNSEVVALRYDADGNPEGITPPDRPEHTFASNGVDQVDRYTPPDVVVGDDFTEYLYDDDHALTDILRPDGKVVSFEYDTADRIESVLADSGDRVLEYWSTGQLRSVSESGGGQTELTWDGPLLLGVERTGTAVGEVTWTHNHDFSVASETVVGSAAIPFGYDDDGLLVSIGGQTVSRHAATGAVAGTALGEVTSSITYSSFGEPASLSYAYDATPLFEASYEYDALGRIETKTETIGGVTTVDEYGYDAAGRLDFVMRGGFELFDADYDGNGNRTSLEESGVPRIADHDEQDRLLEDGDFAYAYNAAGELTTRTNTATSDITTFAYHELGGLLEVDLPGGVEITYRLDGGQRRIGKSVDGVLERGWLYGAQLGPVAELDGSGAIVARFVYGTLEQAPDFMERGGNTYRFVTDHLGSIRLVVNVDTGAVAQRLDYGPWGVVTQDSNPGFQPFGYAGGLYDPDTGLVRFGVRDYDGRAGRWTTKDPIGFAGGDTNVYGYVAGDPINLVDPTGLAFDSVSRSCALNPVLCAEAGLLGGAVGARGNQIVNVVQRGASIAGGACQRVQGLTGQFHHAISRTIWTPLNSHPTLRGLYLPRDNRFLTQAADSAAHRGYQTWHRVLDREIADWIANSKHLTPQQFEMWLREVYQRADLASRFPNGL
jgi:RHS repeat-associated protein